MAFDITRIQLLNQAIYFKGLYDKTGNDEYQKEEFRLRRIVAELEQTRLGATTLDELDDVTITTPTNGQALVYNSSTSQWVNSTLQRDGLYSMTASSDPITNTTTPGNLIDGGVGYLTIPANGFAVGDAFIAYFSGTMSCLNNEDLRILISTAGGVTLADTGFINLPAITGHDWELHINFVVRQIGAAGTAAIKTTGRFFYNKDASNTPENIGFRALNNTTFDTTISNTLQITAQWGAADTGNTIQSDIFNLYRIY